MDSIILFFDGTYVGNIDRYIIQKYYKKDKLYEVELNIQDNLKLNLIKLNKFVLILNEVKDKFFISKIYYNIVSIYGEDYIAYEKLDIIPLLEYTKHNNINGKILKLNLQRLFVFNWLMCINNNLEHKIYTFPARNLDNITETKTSKNVYFITVNEKSFKYSPDECQISQTILKKYFEDSNEKFEDLAKMMVRNINMDKLRTELLKIVKKYDESYISWVNVVYKRLSDFKE